MGRHKKLETPEQAGLTEDQYLPKKPSIAKLSGQHINQFVGDTTEHALKDAWSWIQSKNEDKEYPYKFTLVDYFEQRKWTSQQSILISYNKENK